MGKIWTISIFVIFVLSVASQSGLYTDIYKDVESSVVVVQANDSQDKPRCQGTGFFINKNGDIITNLHNINGSSKVKVITSEMHTYQVKNVLAKDISSDLVCLSVDIPSRFVSPIKLNTTPPEVGDDILVVGYPEGPGGFVQSMTKGIISSIQTLPEYGEVIQIDAAVSPGASGSPLVNIKREAIGVTTFGYIKGQRQNFAISCMQVSRLIQEASQMHSGTPIFKWNLTSEENFYATAMDLYRKGKYDDAVQAFNKALELNPEYVLAWKGKAKLYDSQNKLGDAIYAYNRVIEIDPNDADAWYNKGSDLNSLNEFDSAIQAFNKAKELNSEYAGASWFWIGVIYGKQGRNDEEIKAYDKAIELIPQCKDAWYNKGCILVTLGMYDEAIQAYNNALATNDSSINTPSTIELSVLDSVIWLKKGEALNYIGNYNEAIKAFSKAIELDPQFVYAWNDKGEALGQIGNCNEAIKAFNKAIELDPQYAYAWNNKGNCLFMQGKYDEAIQAYNTSILIDPYSVLPWYNEGNCLLKQGKYDEGIQFYDKATEIDPRYAIAWNSKGVILKELGRTTEAEVAFEKAKELGYTS